jgi:hypothetical protein
LRIADGEELRTQSLDAMPPRQVVERIRLLAKFDVLTGG